MMNDFNNPFNRDPRSGNVPSAQDPTAANQAAAFAAAAALMQQQWPNGQPQAIDPSIFMLGLPFLPQVSGSTGQPANPGMNFNMMQNANLRMRPPFAPGNPPQSSQQGPPASSWERFNRGQGNLSPPL